MNSFKRYVCLNYYFIVILPHTQETRVLCFFTRIKHSLLFFTYNPGSVSYLLQSVLLLPRSTICSIFVILVQPFWSNKPPLPYSLHQITNNDLKLEPWWLVFWDPKWVYCESCADTLKEKKMLIMLVKARLRSLKSYRLDSPDDREKGLQKIAKTIGGLETFLLRLK